MKATILSLVVALILGSHVVDADLATCMNTFKSEVNRGNLDCDTVTIYIKCVMRESDFSNPIVSTNSNLQMMKEKVDLLLNKARLSCYINLRSIVQELQQEESQNKYQVINRPTSYNKATTVNECLDVFKLHNSSSCSEFTPYIRCILRVSNLNKVDSDMQERFYKEYQAMLDKILSHYGLNCHINVKAMAEQIHQEQNNGSGANYRSISLVTLMTLTVMSVAVLY